jgi:hypothetical protein
VQFVVGFTKSAYLPSSCSSVSVCLYAYISAAPTGRIFLKFGIGVFHENLSKKMIFLKSDKIIARCTSAPESVLLLCSTLNRHKIAALLWHGIRHVSREGISVRQTRHDVTLTGTLLVLLACVLSRGRFISWRSAVFILSNFDTVSCPVITVHMLCLHWFSLPSYNGADVMFTLI